METYTVTHIDTQESEEIKCESGRLAAETFIFKHEHGFEWAYRGETIHVLVRHPHYKTRQFNVECALIPAYRATEDY
jgi:hypothetical protein